MPSTETNIRHVHVAARRWFDGTSTYHSVRVLVDGDEVVNEPFVYGYGSQYEQTAVEGLILAGVLDGTLESIFPLSLHLRERGVKYTTDVVDVTRKRDL